MTEPAERDAPFAWPRVRVIDARAPWRWLRRGWEDLRAAPAPGLFYGAVLAAMGFALTRYYAGAVGIALTTGFLLVGPFLAIGLYEVSRRREQGASVALAPTLTAWKANFASIGFYALILTLSLAVWIRVSVVVVALFFPDGTPTLVEFLAELGRSPDAWAFLLAYVAAGGALALFVFATSAVSLPMLLDRVEMDVVSAMIVSFNVLRTNLHPMLLWGAIVVMLTALGFASLYVGLIVALPVIGYGTWHAYRETVAAAD
ncbi:MAG: DUF2189 domain-containing protein [Burkholderiales bacterium]|nr:DUF2189 domain-containing protein [Burkholderiales bacterium]